MATIEWNKPTRGWPSSLKLFHTSKQRSSFPTVGSSHSWQWDCPNAGTAGEFTFLAAEEGGLTDTAEAGVYARSLLGTRYPISSCKEARGHCREPPLLIKAPLTSGEQSQLQAVKQYGASQTFGRCVWSANMLYPVTEFVCKEELSERWGTKHRVTGFFSQSVFIIQ